jgi:hypothetical protein
MMTTTRAFRIPVESKLSSVRSRSTSIRILVTSSVFAALVIAATGCSDKGASDKGSSEAAAAKATSAFGMLPADCDVVFTTDLSSKAAEELRLSPLGRLSKAGDTAMPTELPGEIKITAEQVEVMKLMEELRKVPLVAEPSKFLESSVGCVRGVDGTTPVFLSVSKIRAGAEIGGELSAIETTLKAGGHTVSRATTQIEGIGDAVLIAAQLSKTAQKALTEGGSEGTTTDTSAAFGPESTWYMVQGADRFVVGNSKAEAESVLKGLAPAQSFQSNAAFLEHLKLLGSSANQLGVVYVRDPQRLSRGPGASEGKAPVDAGTPPVAPGNGFFIANASYDGTRESGALKMNAFISPDADEAVKAQLSELAKLGGISTQMTSSLRSVFDLSISAKSLLQSLAKSSPQAAQELKNLPDVSELSFGLALPSGASPFPDLYGTVETTDPATVISTLKLLLDKQKMLSAWQTRKIGETDVQLALSPMGVGAFLASLDNRVVFATSQPAIEAMIAAKRGNGADAGGGTLFRFVISGKESLALAKAMQGTLAMFTGGQANFDLGKWSEVEKIGNSSLRVKVEETGVRVNGEIVVGPQ